MGETISSCQSSKIPEDATLRAEEEEFTIQAAQYSWNSPVP